MAESSVSVLPPAARSSNGGSGSSSSQHSRTNSSGSAKGLLLSVVHLNNGPQQRPAAAADSNCEEGDLDMALKSQQICHTTPGSSGPASLSSNNGTDPKMSVIESSSSPSLSSAESPSRRSMGQGQSEISRRLRQPRPSSTAMDNNNSLLKDRPPSDCLQDDLDSLREQLVLKDEEILRLSRIRDDVEHELEDLTASLFEEAHKMVRDANVKQASAEKGLVEANMKIEVLQTEVSALKTLVLTSTPSQPNPHLHPQIDPKNQARHVRAKSARESDSNSLSSLPSSFLRSPKGSGNASPRAKHTPNDATSSSHTATSGTTSLVLVNGTLTQDIPDSSKDEEAHFTQIDPVLRKEYLSWKKAPSLDRKEHPFLERIYAEDIDLCLAFPNQNLGASVREGIHENTLCLSPVQDFAQVPRNCSLLEAPVLCKYRLQLQGSDDTHYYISQLSRNRITAVCNTLNYLRYITQGLVKAHVNHVYWEIMALRRKMALARLGFEPE